MAFLGRRMGKTRLVMISRLYELWKGFPSRRNLTLEMRTSVWRSISIKKVQTIQKT